jgi:hypothetical protein
MLPNSWDIAKEGNDFMMTPGVNEELKRPNMVLGRAPKKGMPAHLQQEPTVTMIFPNRVGLQLDDGMGFIQFQEGVQEVPESLKNHDHLRKQGVKLYVKNKPANLATEQQMIEELKQRGYQVQSADKVPVVSAPEGGPDRGKVAVGDETQREETAREAAEQKEEDEEDVQPADGKPGSKKRR